MPFALVSVVIAVALALPSAALAKPTETVRFATFNASLNRNL